MGCLLMMILFSTLISMMRNLVLSMAAVMNKEMALRLTNLIVKHFHLNWQCSQRQLLEMNSLLQQVIVDRKKK